MFGFLKRKQPDADAGGISGSMFDEIDQEHERLIERIGDCVDQRLERMMVSVQRRRFIPRGGKAMDIAALARRIHADEPEMPLDDIESCIVDWLEQSYWPDGLSEAKMEKLQVKIDAWIESHWNATELA